MRLARAARTNPRMFVLGAGAAIALIASGFLLALTATGRVGATHDDGSTVHVCASMFTGNVRMVPPGQPPNCSTSEFLVELGAGDPAENLNYEVRTVTFDFGTSTSGQAFNTVHCEQGETAISGGSRVLLADQFNIVGSIDINKGGGPIGSPPTGWQDGFEWDQPQSDLIELETWVICVS